MKELKITPISIDASTTVAGIGKNISDVVAFQIALAKDINRAIAEFNDILPSIAVDDDIEVSVIDEFQSKIASLEKLVNSNRNESGLKLDILEQKVNKITGVK
jgi:hypothetical protein